MVQENRSLRTLAPVLGAALLLGACSILSPRPPEPSTSPPISRPTGPTSRSPLPPPPAQPTPQPLPPPAREPAPTRENHLSPATRSLVTQARTLMSRGDLIGASSTLDRALRIEPNNPLLWIERGRLRLTDGDAHQAEGCGRKALSLASGDRGTQAQAGRLLADALRAQGRNQEANEVERQPFMR
jgi:tetratricopeptide (TPR) repeat protein